MKFSWLLLPLLFVPLLEIVHLWRRARERNERERINGLIKPLKPRYSGFDPRLAARSVARRKEAEEIRRKADRVDSGAPVADGLRRVR